MILHSFLCVREVEAPYVNEIRVAARGPSFHAARNIGGIESAFCEVGEVLADFIAGDAEVFVPVVANTIPASGT